MVIPKGQIGGMERLEFHFDVPIHGFVLGFQSHDKNFEFSKGPLVFCVCTLPLNDRVSGVVCVQSERGGDLHCPRCSR